MQQLSVETLEREVKDVISKIIEVAIEKITPDAHLVTDLGADSMMVLEIMVALDKKYGITIPEADLPKLTTVNEILKVIRALQGHA